MRTLLLSALFAATLLVGACNTIEGAGEDLSRGGENIADASRDVQN